MVGLLQLRILIGPRSGKLAILVKIEVHNAIVTKLPGVQCVVLQTQYL